GVAVPVGAAGGVADAVAGDRRLDLRASVPGAEAHSAGPGAAERGRHEGDETCGNGRWKVVHSLREWTQLWRSTRGASGPSCGGPLAERVDYSRCWTIE